MSEDMVSKMERLMEEPTLEEWCSMLHEKVERLEKEREWQPIDTAPKDGTGFLAASPDFISEGNWHISTCWWLWGEQKYQMCSSQVIPTHWQPLPPPPKGG